MAVTAKKTVDFLYPILGLARRQGQSSGAGRLTFGKGATLPKAGFDGAGVGSI
jgi:hypothetical protein